MQQPFILGIDIGTGSTKAVAVNLSGEAFQTSQAYYNTAHPQPGYSEQDPEMIWEAFLSCISAIQEKLNGQPLGISLSSVMHSLIAVNRDGYPIYPMITWVDARSAGIAEKIRYSGEGETIYRNTGTPVFAMSPLTKIIWLKEKSPLIFNEAFKFISIKEYIWHKLFGVYEVDHSIASGSGLFDILTLEWSSSSLQLAGITADRLSIPVSTGHVRSDFVNGEDKITSILDGTPFVIGGSDGCLANLGSLAIEKGVAAITIGTSGAVRLANATPVYNFQAMTFNYRLDEQTYICGGPVNNGGIAVQWWLKHIKGSNELTADDYAILFDRIESIPAASEGLLFLPYLTGERAPLWDTKSSGVFLGMRLHHTTAHFSRAVLEGICFGLNQVLEALEQGSGEITRVHVSGGFVSSKTWIQLLADVTGKKMAIVQTEDASATGAAMLAMKSLKLVAGYEELIQKRKMGIVEPDTAKHEIYKKTFQVFKQIYEPLKDVMHLLHHDNS